MYQGTGIYKDGRGKFYSVMGFAKLVSNGSEYLVAMPMHHSENVFELYTVHQFEDRGFQKVKP